MISGFGGLGKLAVYPENLYERVMTGLSKTLEMRLFNRLSKLDKSNLSEAITFIEDVEELAQEKFNVVLKLMEDLSWDLSFYVLSATAGYSMHL